MQGVQCERAGSILVVKLAREKANALNGAMVEALNAAVEDAARNEEIRGLVLTSDLPGIFSTGFDVLETFEYDRETLTIFLSRFIDLYETLYLLPKPVVAGISGQAYAGGAMLAIAADFRIMARGNYGIALNEVNIGLPLPPGFLRILAAAVGIGHAREVVLSGEAADPERALAIGLVNELADPGRVKQRAIDRCSDLARKPAAAFAADKRLLREIGGRWATDSDRSVLDQFISSWFSPEAEALRSALAAALTGRKAKE